MNKIPSGLAWTGFLTEPFIAFARAANWRRVFIVSLSAPPVLLALFLWLQVANSFAADDSPDFYNWTTSTWVYVLVVWPFEITSFPLDGQLSGLGWLLFWLTFFLAKGFLYGPIAEGIILAVRPIQRLVRISPHNALALAALACLPACMPLANEFLLGSYGHRPPTMAGALLPVGLPMGILYGSGLFVRLGWLGRNALLTMVSVSIFAGSLLVIVFGILALTLITPR